MKKHRRQILAGLALAQCLGMVAFNQGNNVKSVRFLDNTASESRAIVSTTYYDGLGRERYRVATGAGGGDENITWRTDYDRRGNIELEWLPVSGTGTLFTASAFKNAIKSQYANDSIPYTQYVYTDLGVNRVSEVKGPGKLWKNHGSKYKLHANELTGDYSCVKYTVGAHGSVIAGGMYKPHTLSIEEVIDPDGIRTLVFKNRRGLTVMERRIGTGGSIADTRMMYDVAGNLRYTFSPEGSTRLPATGMVSQDLIDEYAQVYEYDLWNRCISARVPGCGETQYVYNRMDAVCMQSSAEQRKRNEWTVTKFDSQLRPAITGTVTLDGATRKSLQAQYGDSLMIETHTPEFNLAEGNLMYSNNCGPQGFSPYMAWYYDSYDFIVGPNASEKTNFNTSATDGYTAQSLCTGMARVENNNLWLSAVRYDHRGLPVRTCMWDVNMQNRRLTTVSTYDFAGNETQRTEKLESLTEGTVVSSNTAITKTTYDGQCRPVKTTLKVDGGAEITLSQLEYDNLGRISRNTGVHPVEYAYDTRSNLIGITSPKFVQLAFYGCQHINIGPVSYTGINGQETYWLKDSINYHNSEAFLYDDLGRYNMCYTPDASVFESVVYDLDANPRSIMRLYKGDLVQDASISYYGGMATQVQDCSYPYWMDRVGRFPDGEFTLGYDSDGRLTSDGTRGITAITYHPFGNLPKRITMKSGDYVQSDYLPDGTLMRRTFSTRTVQTVTQITATGDTIVKSRPVTRNATRYYYGAFEGTPDGMIYHTPAGYYDLKTRRHYWYLRDRMGSTVAVLDADANFVQTTGYYPSGTPYQLLEERLATKVDAATDRLHIGNAYLSHSGLNMYDNTARLHDPLLMRFGTPDPLYFKSPGASPWAHCSANPLNSIDPDGRADFFMVEDGVLKNVGTDGKEDDILAIVDKKVGKQIRKLTEAGQYYEGPVENSTSMAIPPTLDDFEFIESLVTLANNTQRETGGDKNEYDELMEWKLGMEFDVKKGLGYSGIIPFKPKNPTKNYKPENSKWYFHVHPIVEGEKNTGFAKPSKEDKGYDKKIRRGVKYEDEMFKYKGATFLIGGRDGNITFYHKNKVISTINLQNLKEVIGKYVKH